MLVSTFAALVQELVSWHVPQAGAYLVGNIYATAVVEAVRMRPRGPAAPVWRGDVLACRSCSHLGVWASASDEIVLVDAHRGR
jgi:hypothetical protein